MAAGVLALLGSLLVTVGGGSMASAVPVGTISMYTAPGIQPGWGITFGADGALWFLSGVHSIGRITTGGTVTNYTDPAISDPGGLTSGPDGALWFSNRGSNSIGRITTAGAVSTYTGPGVSFPGAITSGPDGAIWFTNLGLESIGRITTSGAVSIFTDPSINAPFGITSGPDGALWFLNVHGNSIGRITTSGVFSNFTGPGINSPGGFTSGPDGALWFTNNGNASIGRITLAGVVSNFTGPGISFPQGIASGPDGALWFVNAGGTSIGRITTAGVVSNFSDPGISHPLSITSADDGALWFTSSGTNAIGRVVAVGPPAAPQAVVGVAGPSQATVSWSAPPDDGGSAITGYTVTASPGGATCAWSSGPLVCTVNGLTNGTSYTFTVTATNAVGTGPASAPSAAVVPDSLPVMTPAGTAIAEGDSGTSVVNIPVTLSKPWPVAVSASWSTADFQATGGSDFVAASGTVTFAPGETSKTVPVTITGDTTNESDEQFLVTFTDGVNATIGGPYQSSFVTITDDDTLALVVPGGVGVVEGDAGTTVMQVPVRLTHAVGVAVTVPWSTMDYQATAGSDFVAASGTVTFAPGETAKTVSVTITGDTTNEADEYLLVSFTNPTNARLGGFYGLGFGLTIDDDTLPMVVPGGVGMVEGNSGTTSVQVPVTLSHAVGVPVTVAWSTLDYQATVGSDVVAASGTVTFAPGETTTYVTVQVNGDTTVEPNEYFLVSFSNPTNARIGGFYGLGLGLIVNDD